MQQIFVYGTLKRGDCRHDAIADQKYLGIAITESDCRLYDLGEYPALVKSADGCNVSGELYEVTEECLVKLDVIEAVAEGLYSRQSIQLLPPWHESEAQTYIYEQSIVGCKEIEHWSVN